MLLHTIPQTITIMKGMNVNSVHTLVIPEDLFEIRQINKQIRTLKPHHCVIVHYEYGFYVVCKNKERYSIRFAYKKQGNRHDIQFRTFKTNECREVMSVTRDFLSGNYEHYINLGLK